MALTNLALERGIPFAWLRRRKRSRHMMYALILCPNI